VPLADAALQNHADALEHVLKETNPLVHELFISDPSAVEIRMSRNEEVSQATKGDDSVAWIGKVK
jgi:hypothetical protein